MTPKKTNTLNTKEQLILHRLQMFARRNRLELFNVKGSLHDRIHTLADNGGACPCKPDERPHCPCKYAVKECKDGWHCFCQVFLSKDWKEKRQKELDSYK